MTYSLITSKARLASLALGMICAAFSLEAGTIITANLPANTVIVNIDSRNDGSVPFMGSPASIWRTPFSLTGGTPINLTLAAGTYNFRVVDQTDAQGLYPLLTNSQLTSIYTAWSYNSAQASTWVNDYLIFDSTQAQVQLISGAITKNVDFSGFINPATAYQTSKTKGYFNEIITGTVGRYGGTVGTSFTFANPTTLYFAIPDNGLGDNAGGVSVLISPVVDNQVVPEPSSMVLAAAGVLVLLRLKSCK